MKTTAVLIIGILCFILGGVIVYYFMPQIKTEIVVSDANIDSTLIIQDARLGYVPFEELQEVVRQKAKRRNEITYSIIDSVRITDSLNVRDSVVISYMPYFYADTVLKFNKKNLAKGYDFKMDLYLGSKFYPISEQFQTIAKVREFEIKIIYEQPWKFEPYSGVLGFGAGLLTTAGIVYLTK